MNVYGDIKTKTLRRGTVLQHAGDITKVAYRVKKGCLKSYVIDKSGKEHIVHFAPEDWFISDMGSFFSEKPSDIFIEAIEDSEVMVLQGSSFKNLADLNNEMLVDINHKLRNSLIATNKRLVGLLSFTAEERYIEFTKTYPMLVQRLPLKLIASYIGITPEYLSEIRRKIVVK